MKWWSWVCVALVFLVPVASQVHAKSTSPQHGGEYRFSLPASPKTLDPARAADVYGITLIQQIFDGLVQFDENLNVIPAIARSWKVSRDGLLYHFALRNDVRFHHGRLVKAGDFVDAFARILDPDIGSNAAGLFSRILGAQAFMEGRASSVSGLRAAGPHDLEIRLAEPYPPFLPMLAMKSAKIVPSESIKNPESFARHPIGTGPFRFVRWASDTRVVLEANDGYFEGRPFLDQITYVIYPGFQSDRMVNDFLEKKLDNVTVDSLENRSILSDSGCQFVRKPTLSLLFYGINCNRHALCQPEVRRALNLAVDRDAIVSLRERYVVSKGVIPPGMPGYNPDQTGYPFDPEKARSLLTASGYPEGKGLGTVHLWSASRSELAQSELAIVRKNFQAIGVSMEVHYETDWSAFETVLKEGRFDLFRFMIFSDIPDPEDSVLALFPSDSAYNFCSYRKPRFDRLMEKTRREINPVNRARLFRQVEQIIIDDCPIIPVLHFVYEGAFQPYVRGVELNALGSQYIPMKKVWLEK